MEFDIGRAIAAVFTGGLSEISYAINHAAPEPSRGGSMADKVVARLSNDSTAERVVSDNNNTVALAQVKSQEFSLRQNQIDHELQNSAKLELDLDNYSGKLQTALLEYKQQMTVEEDRHQERLAQSRSLSEGDFPAPSIE